jgi:hypothetical protein
MMAFAPLKGGDMTHVNARIITAACLAAGVWAAPLASVRPAQADPAVVLVPASASGGVQVDVSAGDHTMFVGGSYLYCLNCVNPNQPASTGWLATADAECSTYYNPWSPLDFVPHRYGSGGSDLLDLTIDGAHVEWTPVVPNPAYPGCALGVPVLGLEGYVYSTQISLSSARSITLRVDDPGYWSDNAGVLAVAIQ